MNLDTLPQQSHASRRDDILENLLEKLRLTQDTRRPLVLVETLLSSVNEVDRPFVFWNTFQRIDVGFWGVPNSFLQLLRSFLTHRDLCLDDTHRKALNALPDVVTAYRGCSEGNVENIFWSPDIRLARLYLYRPVSLPKPGLARAKIAKKDVFFAGWSGSEILVDYEKLDGTTFKPVSLSQHSAMNALTGKALLSNKPFAASKLGRVALNTLNRPY